MKPSHSIALCLLSILLLTVEAKPVYARASRASAGPSDSKAKAKVDSDDDDSDADADADDDSGDDKAATAPKGAQPEAEMGGSEASDGEDADTDDDDDDDDAAADPTTITANVAVTSDYMLRGLTQTNGQPAVQGGFEWDHPIGIDLSAWGSNVRFPDSPTSVELDFGGGFSHEFDFGKITGVTLRLGGLYYWYVDDSSRNSWDVQGSLEWNGFKGEVDFSPHWEGTTQHSWYFNLGWTDEVLWGFTPGAFAGYSLYPSGSFYPSYADFKVSLSHEFLGLTWEAAGVFTKVQRLTENETIVDPDEEDLTLTRSTQIVLGGSRAVFTVSKSF